MQESLLLARAASPVAVGDEAIARRRDLLGAINLCVEVSGLDDKELYLAMGIDAGQWSRIRKGDAHFPPNKLLALMALCGNEVPLQWLAWKCGKGLHELESETQRLLREANEALVKEREKSGLLRELLQGRGA